MKKKESKITLKTKKVTMARVENWANLDGNPEANLHEYRVTFTCDSESFHTICDEITAYGWIKTREMNLNYKEEAVISASEEG